MRIIFVFKSWMTSYKIQLKLLSRWYCKQCLFVFLPLVIYRWCRGLHGSALWGKSYHHGRDNGLYIDYVHQDMEETEENRISRRFQSAHSNAYFKQVLSKRSLYPDESIATELNGDRSKRGTCLMGEQHGRKRYAHVYNNAVSQFRSTAICLQL